MRGKALIPLAGVAVGAAAGFAITRRVVRRGPAVQRLPPDLRSALLYALPEADPAQPPRRGTLAERLLARLPAQLGRPLRLPARDGAPPVAAFLYETSERTRPSGAVLWIHGGGMISGAPWLDHGLCTRLARELGVLVLSVDYRLAPEHPFPAGPDDCYTGLTWLHGEAERRGIDPSRVAVGGESAGGGLAAMVAQMALDRGLPVAFQALVYPMLDDRTALAPVPQHRGELVWTPDQNREAWRMFLGHPLSPVEDRPYAAAARRENLQGLPPAWIGVGDRDLFFDEDVAYAGRLREAGVAVALVTVEGMPHGLDAAQWKPRMRGFRDGMVAALATAVSGPSAVPATSPWRRT